MATGNIKGGKRNYARPGKPIVTTVASTTVAEATVSVSGGIGPQATSYTISASSPNTASVIPATQTGVTTSATFTGLSSSQTYTFTAFGINQNGSGTADTTTSNAVTAAAIYALSETFSTTGSTTATVPTFATKMAALVIGGGGSGGNYVQFNSTGSGGGGGGATVFKDFTVTGGTTFTVIVGSATGISKITYGGTDIATANGGNSASGGTIGNGGTGSSNVAGATFSTGGAGGQQTAGPRNSSSGNGGNATQLVPYSLTNTNITTGHGGGGAGGQDRYNTTVYSQGGSSGGGRPDGNALNPTAGSGGGGGGAFYNTDDGNPGSQANGQTGANGSVILYYL